MRRLESWGDLNALLFWAADVGLWVKAPTKPEDLSLILGPTWWKREQP